ncbi:MAG: rhodanese-like domain-containing protein [Parachlamydiaceae bacterium]
MLIRHFFTPGLAINTYLIFDEVEKRGALIDPTRQVERYISQAIQDGVQITDIFETHVHADFVSGALELKKALNNKPTIHCSGMGGKEWIPCYADHIVQDHDDVRLGSLRFQAWHTPGHTPEHVIWLVFDERRSLKAPEIAFTGDLLFVGSVGRPDLLGPAAEEHLAKQLYHSLFKLLHSLPDFVEIYPAHGAGSLCGKAIGSKLSSTFGYEKQCNPGLVPQPYGTWLKQLHDNMPPAPHYFSAMKRINVTGPRISERKEALFLLTKEHIREHISSYIFLDVRRPEEFSSGHIKNAINVPFSPSFPQWAGVALPENPQLVIVLDTPELVSQMITTLKLIGIDDILGYINIREWNEADKKEMFVASPMIDVKELGSKPNDYYVIDVRTLSEWNAGHIDGAHHLELAKSPEFLSTIPGNKPIAVICHSGNRASIVASLLMREGREKVFNVRGGMQAWLAERLPVL